MRRSKAGSERGRGVEREYYTNKATVNKKLKAKRGERERHIRQIDKPIRENTSLTKQDMAVEIHYLCKKDRHPALGEKKKDGDGWMDE